MYMASCATNRRAAVEAATTVMIPPTALLERNSCRGFAKASSLRKPAIFFYLLVTLSRRVVRNQEQGVKERKLLAAPTVTSEGR
jgi:hypothetical protein